MKKGFVRTLTAVAILGAFLTGCGSKAASQPEESSGAVQESGAANKDAVKVRILTRFSNPDSVREKYFMDMETSSNKISGFSSWNFATIDRKSVV